jgi:hypothetical protein
MKQTFGIILIVIGCIVMYFGIDARLFPPGGPWTFTITALLVGGALTLGGSTVLRRNDGNRGRNGEP